MVTFIYGISKLQLFILILGISVIVSMLGLWLYKRLVSKELSIQGTKSMFNIKSTINYMYAILIGFTLLYSFNQFNTAQTNAEYESMLVMRIYNNAKWLPEPFKSNIIIDLQKYTTAVISYEWPLLRTGKKIDLININLMDINNQLLAYTAKNLKPSFNVKNIFDLWQELKDIRRQRINLESVVIFPEFWLVIFIITFTILIISYFSYLNLYFHIFLTTGLILSVSATIFLLTVIDRPFRGDFSVKPTGFENVLKILNNDPAVKWR